MKKIKPGIYLSEGSGTLIADIPEILNEIGATDTPAARRAIARHFQKLFKNMFPDAPGKVTK